MYSLNPQIVCVRSSVTYHTPHVHLVHVSHTCIQTMLTDNVDPSSQHTTVLVYLPHMSEHVQYINNSYSNHAHAWVLQEY